MKKLLANLLGFMVFAPVSFNFSAPRPGRRTVSGGILSLRFFTKIRLRHFYYLLLFIS